MTQHIDSRAPLASPAHRLGANAVDAGLMLVTLFIGWAIWSLVMWGSGQTPGKSILKIRVLNEPTGTPATWGQMLIRQLLIGWTIGVPYLVAYVIYMINPNTISLVAYVLSIILYYCFFIVDIVWVFGPTRRRLIDYFAGTIVVNEAGVRQA
jgi:uncharacterized RDD family membrane protein YckC